MVSYLVVPLDQSSIVTLFQLIKEFTKSQQGSQAETSKQDAAMLLQ